jgi:hypothetical protein
MNAQRQLHRRRDRFHLQESEYIEIWRWLDQNQYSLLLLHLQKTLIGIVCGASGIGSFKGAFKKVSRPVPSVHRTFYILGCAES